MDTEFGRYVEKVWGREYWIVNCPDYGCKILTLKGGYECSVHKHRCKHECFYILKGKVLLQFGMPDEEPLVVVLGEGGTIDIPRGLAHCFRSLVEESQVLEVSTTHSEEDSERFVESRKLPDDVTVV